jgi:hypothetical protein
LWRQEIDGTIAQGITEEGSVMATFSVGDRVLISPEFFWAKGATGTISTPPSEVTTLSGPWRDDLTRQERSALGEATVYWVWFDEPQRDADWDGPYRGGCIHENAMTLIRRISN